MVAVLRLIITSYLFVMLVAIVVGVTLPNVFAAVPPWNTYIIGTIFFFSALTISFADVRKYAKDVPLLVVVLLLMLVVFPVVVYFTTHALYPSLALPFLLLAAMPSGMTAPLLAEIAGGKHSLALVLTVTTSLIAPFSVPLVVYVLLGSSVAVDVWDMFLTLLTVIGVPFLFAALFRRVAPTSAKRIGTHSKGFSVALLALLVAGVVAEHAPQVVHLSLAYILLTLLALFCVFALLHLLGYVAVFWRDKRERVAVSVCLTYMNFVLALYLADTFFPEQGAVVPIMLAVVPWALMLTPFRLLACRNCT
jgi:BASS family bile acid:Na+ symporter